MTTIKITALTDIGANIPNTTLIPVVDMTGTPTTDKATFGNVANAILSQAGNNYSAATKAINVTASAQPNITSVGTLTALSVTGNVTANIYFGDGGFLSNVTGGNATPGGSNSQVQYNDNGAFGGDPGMTYNEGTSTLTANNFIATSNSYLGNISTTGSASITTLLVGATANLGAVGNVIITGGTNGQVLTTNGTGGLSWASVSGNGTYGNADVANYLPTYTGNLSGGNLNVPSNLSFDINTNNGNGGTYAWTFGNDGKLYWPGDDDHTIYNGANNSFIIHGHNNIVISTDGANANYQYQFYANGDLGIPGNVSATVFSGNGSSLSAIAGANVTGFVPNANVANTAFAVAGANVSGTVGNANLSQYLNVSDVNNNFSYHIVLSAGSGDKSLHIDADDNLQYNPADGTLTATRVDATYVLADLQFSNGYPAANVTGLGNIATINLTGSNSNVLYGNGVFAAVAGGGGNTGNVTFDDNIVIGTGDEFGSAGLFLAPGNGSIANSAVQYLRVRGGDAPTHIHLDTGNNEYYDQYFGADSRYLKLEANGNVVINADDYAANSGTWTFTTDGNLILADGNSVIQSIANSSLDILNPNVSTMVLTPDPGYGSQALVLDPTLPGHIHLRAPGANIDEPTANLFLGGEDTAFEITEGANNQAVIHSNGKAWTFGNDGNISSDTLTFTTTFANVKTVEYQTAGVWDLYVEDSITGSNTASSRLNVSFKDNLIDKPQVYIENTKESDGIALRWTFDENGNLNFPRDVAGNSDPYLNIFGGSTPTIQSTDVSLAGPANLAIQSDYLNLSGSTGNRIILQADAGAIATDANIVLSTNLADLGNVYSWTLDTTGNLTLPDTTSVIANVSITLEANDTGNITGLNLIGDSNANLYAHSNVNIVSDGGNREWTFDTTGTLTAPGDITVAGDITGTAGANTLVLKAQPNTNTSIQLNSIVDSTIRIDANLEIVTDSSNTSQSWNFDIAGNLTLPGNTFAVNYANGTQVSIGGANTGNIIFDQSTIESNQSNAYINLNASGSGILSLGTNDQANVRIVTDEGNVNNQWTFDTTGNLTLPGNLVIAGNTAMFGSNIALIQANNDLPLISLSSGANGGVSSVWLENQGDIANSNIAAVYTPLPGTGTLRLAVGSNGSNVYLWDFDNTGNLTLPSNTLTINFANGSSAFGNIVATNLDGNVSNVLTGNGTFAAVPAPTVTQDITSNGNMSIMLYDGNIKYSNNATVEPSSGNIAGNNISATGNVTAQGVGTNLVRRANTISGSNTAVTLDNLTALVGGTPKRLYIGAATSNMTMAGQSQTMSTGALAVSSWINVPIVTGTGNGFAMSGAITNDGDTAVLNVTDQGAGSGTWRVTGMIANTSANLYSVSIERLA